MNILKCVFCGFELRNASFSSSCKFVYLTCDLCHKRIIINKEDYEEFIVNKRKDFDALKRWI